MANGLNAARIYKIIYNAIAVYIGPFSRGCSEAAGERLAVVERRSRRLQRVTGNVDKWRRVAPLTPPRTPHRLFKQPTPHLYRRHHRENPLFFNSFFSNLYYNTYIVGTYTTRVSR